MGLLDILNNLTQGPDDPPPEGDPTRIAEVEEALADIRPMLEADGGGVNIIRIEDDGQVILHLFGACSGCHAQASTLYELIQPQLMSRLSWITAVHST
jgi:Fe-S cluster biogenesis protein NfuA